MPSNITVVVTSVGRPRKMRLQAAIASIQEQTLEPDAIVISIDTDRQGAAATRQRGTEQVRTPLVAFLDDDDVLRPEHLAVLKAELDRTGADLVYPWFDVEGGTDPFPMHEGKEWNPQSPIQFPITYLARTQVILDAGGWAPVPEGPQHPDGNRAGEDWRLELSLVAAGARIVHLPVRSWIWNHWVTMAGDGNSSGLPSRVNWDS